jgi:hypothetical protein
VHGANPSASTRIHTPSPEPISPRQPEPTRRCLSGCAKMAVLRWDPSLTHPTTCHHATCHYAFGTCDLSNRTIHSPPSPPLNYCSPSPRGGSKSSNPSSSPTDASSVPPHTSSLRPVSTDGSPRQPATSPQHHSRHPGSSVATLLQPAVALYVLWEEREAPTLTIGRPPTRYSCTLVARRRGPHTPCHLRWGLGSHRVSYRATRNNLLVVQPCNLQECADPPVTTCRFDTIGDHVLFTPMQADIARSPEWQILRTHCNILRTHCNILRTHCNVFPHQATFVA